VTLNDLEPRTGCYFAILTKSGMQLWGQLRQSGYTVCDKNVVQRIQFSSIIRFMAIFAEVSEK